MTKQLDTIEQLIEFIERYKISDLRTINELCDKMLGKRFFALTIGPQPPTTAYYVKHLKSFKEVIDREGNSKRFFLDFGEVFKITDYYNSTNKT